MLVLVKHLPRVSFLIPTFNADKYLEKCLKSIEGLDYPKSKIEVFIVDGGSTDDTISVALNHNVNVLYNVNRIAEYGKKIAFDRSSGSIIVLMDSDNVIASRDWLKRMVYPFENNRIMGVESNYLLADDFSSINSYANLLVIVDPLARMLASKPYRIVEHRLYNIKYYAKNSTPVTGANGFLWRRSIIDEFNYDDDLLNEINILKNISSFEEVKIANVPDVGIYHYYSHSLADYLKKRQKIARKHLQRNQITHTWVAKRGKVRLYLSSMYLVSIVGPMVETSYNLFRYRRCAWIWHPLMSFLTIVIYVTSSLSMKALNNKR